MKKILLLAIFTPFLAIAGGGLGGGGTLSGGGSGVSVIGSNTNIIDTSDMVLGTIYTNNSGSNLVVSLQINATSTDSAALEIDNNHDGSYETIISSQFGAESNSPKQVSGAVNPGGVYTVATAAGTPSIVPGSCQRVYSAPASVVSIGNVSVPASGGLAQLNGTGGIKDSGLSPSSVVTNGTGMILYASKSGCTFSPTVDDSKIINSNLNYISINNGGTWIQDGFSFCTNSILVGNKTHLVGAYPGCGFLAITNLNQPLVANFGYSNQIMNSNIILSGLTIDGNGATTIQDAGGGGNDARHFSDGGVLFSSVKNVVIENCVIKHNPNWAITFGNFDNALIQGCSQFKTNYVFGTDFVHVWGPFTNGIRVINNQAMTKDDAVGLNIDEMMSGGATPYNLNTNAPWVTWGRGDFAIVDNMTCLPVQDPRLVYSGYDPSYFGGDGVRILTCSNRLDSVTIKNLTGYFTGSAVHSDIYFTNDSKGYFGNVGSLEIDNVQPIMKYPGATGTSNPDNNPSFSIIALASKIDEAYLSGIFTNAVQPYSGVYRPFVFGGKYANVGRLNIDGQYYSIGNTGYTNLSKQSYFFNATPISTTNSTAKYETSGHTIPPGTYVFSSEVFAHTASATSGAYCGLLITNAPVNTNSISSIIAAGYSTSENLTGTYTYTGSSPVIYNSTSSGSVVLATGGASNAKTVILKGDGAFTITNSATVIFYINAWTANDAANPVMIYTNSYVRITQQ